jgi:hypothetical protein
MASEFYCKKELNPHLLSVVRTCMVKKSSRTTDLYSTFVIQSAIENALRGSPELNFITFEGMEDEKFNAFTHDDNMDISCLIKPFSGTLIIGVRLSKYESLKDEFVKAVGREPSSSEEFMIRPEPHITIWYIGE